LGVKVLSVWLAEQLFCGDKLHKFPVNERERQKRLPHAFFEALVDIVYEKKVRIRCQRNNRKKTSGLIFLSTINTTYVENIFATNYIAKTAKKNKNVCSTF
jgi:hypothetical protein